MKKIIAPIIIAIIILAFGGTGYYMYSSYNRFLNTPASKNSEQVDFTVESGQLSKSIIASLYEKGLIKNKTYAKVYVKTESLGTSLKAGLYKLDKSMTPVEIFSKLTDGGMDPDLTSITIPEGYTSKQIGEVLVEKGYVEDVKEFTDECNNGSFDFAFIDDIPDGRENRLEGYLFPDTYQLKKNASCHDIINTMLKRFKEVSDSLPSPSGKAAGRNIDDIVIMASIIQGEGAVESELPVISSVFYNRLGTNMLLQSCATVQYALGERKTSLSIADTKIDSPYNTYIHQGLPVGPVGNPGEACLKAATNPSDDNYYYFVTKEDGTKEHYFAKTYEEHLNNIEKSKNN